MNIPELPPASFLRADIFPARVAGDPVEGGPLDNVRVLLTDAHLHVLRLTNEGDIALVYSAELHSIEKVPLKPRGYRVVTAEGDEIELQKSLNCGCGMQRIKGARIFNPPLPLQAF